MQLNLLFVHPSEYGVSHLSLHLCINRPNAAYVRLAKSTSFRPICLILLTFLLNYCLFFFLLALQPPVGVVFYSPLVGFSLLAYEVS